MRPYLLTCIDVPCLHLAEMIGGLRRYQRAAERYARVTSARNVGDLLLSRNCATDVFVRRNIDQAGLRAVRDGRPVLAAMRARAKLRALGGSRFVREIDIMPASYRIQTAKQILIDVRFAFDKLDRTAVDAIQRYA